MRARWVPGPDEAYVWLADPDRLTGPESAALARGVLSPDERARMERRRFDRDRRQYLLAHALVRHALSACVPGVAPSAWAFVANRYGRPELAPPDFGLRFNLSHTDGLVACVVTRGADCGIDVELVRPRGPALLGGHVLAPAERAELAGLPDPERARRFIDYWTLKEAYAKARGFGMSLPLSACVFRPGPGRIALVSHPPDEHPEPGAWEFRQGCPTRRHVLAVAVRSPGDRMVRITRQPPGPAWSPALSPPAEPC